MKSTSLSPFIKWIRILIHKVEKPFAYYVTTDSSLPKVMEWLNMNEGELDDLPASHPLLVTALCTVWNSRNFKRLGIELTKNVVIGGGRNIPIVSKKLIRATVPVVEIDGFLSLPHLTAILHGLTDPVNIDNPFNPYLRYEDNMPAILPDEGALNEIYMHFGVFSFEELIPSRADYDRVFYSKTTSYETISKQLTDILEICCSGGEPTKVVEMGPNAWYTDKLLNVQMQQLELIHSNRMGARGDITKVGRDVFQLITSGLLKGKDLIGLCVSNPDVNAKCNADDQAVFKRALTAEFKITYYPGMWSFATPRDLYVQAHKFCWVLTYDTDRLVTAKRTEGGLKTPLLPNQEVLVPKPIFFEGAGLPSRIINIRGDHSLNFAYRQRPGHDTKVANRSRAEAINRPFFRLLLRLALVEDNMGHTAFRARGLSDLGIESGEWVDVIQET